MDKVISDGVKKGQHIYHILKTHNLDVSSSTVYRHIRKGYLSIAPIDLARAVKFKERRKSKLPSIPADKDFCQLFPVILTDNGGEFARVDDIEMDVRGESKLFFVTLIALTRKGELRKITR